MKQQQKHGPLRNRRLLSPSFLWTFITLIHITSKVHSVSFGGPQKALTSANIASSVSKDCANKQTTQDSSSRTRMKTRRKPAFLPPTLSPVQRTASRRIQQEWKEAIEAGVAFDWSKGQPQRRFSEKKKQLQQQEQHLQNPSNTTIQKSVLSSHIWIGPLQGVRSLRTWHFSFTGLPGSPYEGGLYHGRILLPPDYPSRPPSLQLLSPSGRFKINTDICISASAFHPETWQPHLWSIHSLVEAIRLHMAVDDSHAGHQVGGIVSSVHQRRVSARQSQSFRLRISATTASNGFLIDHTNMIKRGYVELPILDREEHEEVTTSTGCESACGRRSAHTSNVIEDERRIASTHSDNKLLAAIQWAFSSYLNFGLVSFFLIFCVLNVG